MIPLFIASCTLVPGGTEDERKKLAEAGQNFDRPPEQRSTPELSAEATWEQILQRAFLTNGELEAAYFEWKAAMERVTSASTYPNTNLMLGYSYAFSSERMKSFDRMSFSAQPDAMQNLALPVKVTQAGKVALAEAQTAGERFRAMKFDLQRRVLSQLADLIFLQERLRVEREEEQLLDLVLNTAQARVQSGGAQLDYLKAGIALQTATNKSQTTKSELEAARATLNGLLARPASAPLNVKAPLTRIVPSNAVLFAEETNENPELAQFARSVQGRSDALELARLRWLPDVNPSFAFTGNIAQAVGAVLVLPITFPAIQSGIREAEAMLHFSEAMLRQVQSDRSAKFVATLLALRNAERQKELFEQSILPATKQMVDTARQSYAVNETDYLELIEAERIRLEAFIAAAGADAMKLKMTGELEALMGVDLETLETRTVAGSSAQEAK